MKKIFFAIALTAGLLSCVKEGADIVENNGQTVEGQPFRIMVSTDTKTVFNPADRSVTWEAADELAVVVTGAGSSATYKFTKSADVENAFECTGFAPVEGVEYTYKVLYPYVEGLTVGEDGYTTQAVELPVKKDVAMVQSALDDASHVKGALYGAAAATGAESPVVQMKHLTHIVAANITNNTAFDVVVKSVSMTNNGGANLAGTYNINLTNGAVKAAEASQEVTLNVEGTIAAGKTAVVYIPTPAFTVPQNKALTFTVGCADGDEFIVKTAGAEGLECKAGGIRPAALAVELFAGGDGTKDNPYKLATPRQMNNMHSVLEEGKEYYFEMASDIDLEGISWVPLNWDGAFKRKIHFDGKGHTIKNFYCEFNTYPSFFGVLNGECKNVKFENAEIKSSNTTSGIVGAYIGTGGISALVENCHVQGEVTQSNGKKDRGFAGVGGMVVESTVKNCYVDVNVISTLATIANGGAAVVAGELNISNVENCFVTGKVDAPKYNAGGIVGRSNTSGPCSVTGCISWVSEVIGRAAVGSVIGRWNTKKIGTDSVQSKNYSLGTIKTENYKDDGTLNASGFIYGGGENGGGADYSVMGTSTTNACETAKTIGWDETIWDLSGETPQLKLFQ